MLPVYLTAKPFELHLQRTSSHTHLACLDPGSSFKLASPEMLLMFFKKGKYTQSSHCRDLLPFEKGRVYLFNFLLCKIPSYQCHGPDYCGHNVRFVSLPRKEPTPGSAGACDRVTGTSVLLSQCQPVDSRNDMLKASLLSLPSLFPSHTTGSEHVLMNLLVPFVLILLGARGQ